MNRESIPLRSDVEYLTPPRDFWWQWTPDGRWIEWSDGRTIVARRELQETLRRLSPHGLPPLGAILLIIAATRQNWDADRATSLLIRKTTEDTLGEQNVGISLFDSITASRFAAEVKSIVADLAVVADLPPKLRDTVATKGALLDFVLHDQPTVVGTETATGIIELLDRTFDAEPLPQRPATRLRRAEADLTALRVGLAKLGPVDLESWLQTGLESSIAPAPLAIPLALRIRELLRSTRDDSELGGISTLAAQLLAAVNVPRKLQAHEDLPLGGISDISNRGSLDRLLLSELANDEMTLAVRVAMNEALYIRREAPTKHPPTARTIVIDGGIRMWGVPRVFGTAVALALAGSSDPNASVIIARTRQSSTVSVDLGSQTGLREHLASLDPWPDPADGFGHHLDRLLSSAESGAQLEAFLITDTSTLSDPAFWRKLTPRMRDVDLYIAAVSRDGTFELFLASAQGRRLVCSAKLDLDAIITPPKAAKKPSALLDRHPSLPHITRLKHFPLFLPASLDARFGVFTPETGLVGIAKGSRLMRWTDDRVGARQLTDVIPSGQVRGVFADAERSKVYVVSTRQKQSKMVVLEHDLASSESRTSEFGIAQRPLNVVFHQGIFLLIDKHGFSTLHPKTGQVTPKSVPNRPQWLTGRFFVDRDQLLAASDAGLVPVCRQQFFGSLPFDRADGLGPWIINAQLQMRSAYGTASLPPVLLNHGIDHPTNGKLHTSEDRERILLEPRGRKKVMLGITLSTGESKAFHDFQTAHAFLIGSTFSWTRPSGINLRRLLISIGVSSDGEIALQSHSCWHRVVIDAQSSLCVEASPHPPESMRAVQPFTEHVRVPQTDCKLRKASWADGSSAWLDSRGLLHLVSSDKRIPEVTLVLNDTGISGWASDGETFGWRFFLDAEPTMTSQQAMTLFQAFARRLQ